jgi:regulator of PEP synthase PpsR (kinase-PPPase family)
MGAFVVVFLGMTVLALNGVHLLTLPFVRQQETVINRSSQGYVEAKQQQLLGLTQDAARLEGEIRDGRAKGQDTRGPEAQLNATLDRMQTEAALLGRDDVPAPAAAMLGRYGRAI